MAPTAPSPWCECQAARTGTSARLRRSCFRDPAGQGPSRWSLQKRGRGAGFTGASRSIVLGIRFSEVASLAWLIPLHGIWRHVKTQSCLPVRSSTAAQKYLVILSSYRHTNLKTWDFRNNKKVINCQTYTGNTHLLISHIHLH